MKQLKVFKKLLALAASACMLAFLPNANALTVSAEGPVTYYVKWDYNNNEEDWLFQYGQEWDDEAESRVLFFMNQDLKDGDVVIVDGGSSTPLVLNVHLSNLTIKNTTDSLAMVTVTGGIDNCCFLKDTKGSITGNVFNAYVYGGSVANFNNNVSNLYSYVLEEDVKPRIGVTGTVSYYLAEDPFSSWAPRGIDFSANSFQVEAGELTTDSSKYTSDISHGPVAPGAQSSSPAAARPAASGSSTASGEYDAVPKTGENSPAAWLSLIAASCLSLSLIIRRSERR